MTDDLKALCETVMALDAKATPGPWEWMDWTDDGGDTRNDPRNLVQPNGQIPSAAEPGGTKVAHSMSEYRRVKASGGEIEPPAFAAPVVEPPKTQKRYFGVPGKCISIDGELWHEAGECPNCGYEDVPLPAVEPERGEGDTPWRVEASYCTWDSDGPLRGPRIADAHGNTVAHAPEGGSPACVESDYFERIVAAVNRQANNEQTVTGYNELLRINADLSADLARVTGEREEALALIQEALPHVMVRGTAEVVAITKRMIDALAGKKE